MRALACLWVLLLAGCPPQEGDDAIVGGECEVDRQCGSNLCARDHQCLPADELMSVTTTWTLSGEAANTQRCNGIGDFYIHYSGPTLDDELGYSPVPCFTGQFTIDKLPKSYDRVELGLDDGGATFRTAPIVPGSPVLIDLPL